jgi:methylated-DNA-protein-cysteine methyltransferase-like protein
MSIPELPASQQDAFYAAVWRIVRQIPPGKVSTYGQIAAWIPPPDGVTLEDYRAYRAFWAGNAMAACPQDVPWQRVINAQGKISPRPGAELQHQLLEAEGILFDERGRVDLRRYAWAGPAPDWLRANGYIVPEDEPLSGCPFIPPEKSDT